MRKTIQWHIGCSGFHYKEWKEVFYPALLPQKNWFSYYARHFNTLELNTTFYHFPKLSSLQKWYAESPDHFIFSLKAPRLITHYKKFTGTETLLKDFYSVTADGLGNKLGCILFQLPPQFHYSEERLQLIISSLDKTFCNVVEFRHNSWWKQAIYDELGKHNIIFCGSSHPKLKDDLLINTKIAYYRFHGVPVLFKSEYSDDFLQSRIDTIQQDGAVEKAYIYFNNTWGTAALANAQWMNNAVQPEKK